MLAARMRHGNAWSDANILNISSRGLLLHAASPPSRGAFIEVRRGAHVIIGRVIWAMDDRFGVCAQDRLEIGPLIANGPPNRQSANDIGGPSVERRAQPRPDQLEWRYTRSSQKGRSMQFACIIGLGFILAACAYDVVIKTLAQPLSIVSAQFGDER